MRSYALTQLSEKLHPLVHVKYLHKISTIWQTFDVRRVAAARAIVQSGIAVMGHIGLVPQSISVLGGFRPQGQSR